MPRASWKGFLRLSLVSCPVFLSPATTRTKSIRLNQVWVPRPRPAEPAEREENQEDVAPISRGRGVSWAFFALPITPVRSDLSPCHRVRWRFRYQAFSACCPV